MSADPAEPAWATQLRNIEADSGCDLAMWIELIEASGETAHGKRVAWLKSEHGLGHGNANLLVRLAADAKAGPTDDGDLVDGQYAGKKEHLRPILEAILDLVGAFGDDVEIAPKKTSVSLRRSKQFAVVTPATNSRVDLGINLKGGPPADRLEAAKGMCTHKVRLTAPDEVDANVEGWLRGAYERA